MTDKPPIHRFTGLYAFLSNFYPSPLIFTERTYPTVEHAFQAMKTTNSDQRDMCAAMSTPGKAKAFGRSLTLRPDWEDIKLDVMHNLVHHKFATYPSLRKRLIATGDAELFEGNTWNDTFWGVDLITGEGSNHLGEILMRVREEILAEGKT